MNTMTKAEEQDILNSLTKVVNGARSGKDPADCMIKVAKNKGYTMQKVARMCEAYNKSKSIYMLSKTAEDTRADSFPLVDPRDVVARIFNNKHEKQASLAMPDFSDVDFVAMSKVKMEKTAAEQKPFKAQASAPRSFDSEYSELVNISRREKLAANQADQDIRMGRIQVGQAVDEAATILSSYTDYELKKVGQQVFNKYGNKGQQLANLLYAKLNKDAPTFQKTANTTIFKASEPYISISKAVGHLRDYHQALLHKEAMQDKQAVGIVSDYLSNIAAGVTEEAGKKPARVMGADYEPETSEVFSPFFENKLKSLDAIDLFQQVYEDDFLKNQDHEEVIEAFNNVMQAVPNLGQKKNRIAIIRSLVKKQVAEGSQIEPTEIAQFLAMDKLVGETTAKDLESAKSISESSKPEVPELGDKLTGAITSTTANPLAQAAGSGVAAVIKQLVPEKAKPTKKDDKKDDNTS